MLLDRYQGIVHDVALIDDCAAAGKNNGRRGERVAATGTSTLGPYPILVQ
jgi:hypothetical protein